MQHNSATLKQQFQYIRNLISQANYGKALEELYLIDHPKADEWIEKINQRIDKNSMNDQAKGRGSRQQGSRALGALIFTSETSVKFQLFKLIMFIVCLIASIAFLASYLTISFDEDLYSYLSLALSSFMFFGAIATIISFVMAFGQKIDIYHNGLQHTNGNQSKRWYWKDITNLKIHDETMQYTALGIPFMTYRDFSLHIMVSKKRVHKITRDYADYDTLAHYIIARTGIRPEYI